MYHVDMRGLAIAVDHHTIAQIDLYVCSAHMPPDYRTWLPSVSVLRMAGQVPTLDDADAQREVARA